MLYLMFKCVHIISIISWMAGILYLLRLFVNHSERGLSHAPTNALLQDMERRLYRIITLPAMMLSWLAGIGMVIVNPSLLSGGWLHLKITCVVLLTGMTHYAGRLVKRFAKQDGPLPSGRTLRLLNEVPTLLMIVIVVMVVFKPF